MTAANSVNSLASCHTTLSHYGSMGRTVYLPIHEWLIFMVNVEKYIIHGSSRHNLHAATLVQLQVVGSDPCANYIA